MSHLNNASFRCLWNGPVFLGYLSPPFLFSCTKYHHTRSQLSLAWLIGSGQLSSALQRYVAQQRSTVRCRGVSCPALRCGTVLRRAVPCRVLCCTYSFVYARYHSKYQNNHTRFQLRSAWLISSAQLSSAAPCCVVRCCALPCPAVRCGTVQRCAVACCMLCCTSSFVCARCYSKHHTRYRYNCSAPGL